MKNLVLMILLFSVALPVSAQKSKIIIEGQKEQNVDFSKYKTYKFSPQLLDDRNDFFFLNDLMLKTEVIDAVEHELAARGYEQTASNPDLIINFRVFEKPAQLYGFADEKSNYWGGTTVRDNKKTYDVKSGTIMLNIVDKKTGQAVWQGFASGIMDNTVFDKKKERINEAVGLLFNEFHQRADDLSKR